MKTLLTIFLLSGLVQAAPLKGGTAGNGGSSVFVDGKWELADIFMGVNSNEEPLLLSEEIREYAQAIQTTLHTYHTKNTQIIDKLLSEFTDYRYVNELPCADDPLTIDPSIKQTQYGCVKDGIIYLLKHELDKLSFKNRVLALLHESLHLLNPEAEHKQIAEYISTLHTIITLSEEQHTGKLRRLYPLEVKRLASIRSLSCQLASDPCEGHYTYKIHPFGGGVLSKSRDLAGFPKVEETSFIGIGSSLWGDDRMNIGGRSKIFNSYFSGVGNQTFRIIDSELSQVNYFSMGNKSLLNIENSTIRDSKLNDKILMTGSSAERSTLTNVEMLNSHVRDAILKDVKLNHSIILNSELGKMRIKKSKLIDWKLNGYVPIEECRDGIDRVTLGFCTIVMTK